MKLLKVTDSSSIIGMAHNQQLQRMYVEFKQTGLYEYHGVTEDEFQQVFLAQSRGQKLKEIVKGKTYKKIKNISDEKADQSQ